MIMVVHLLIKFCMVLNPTMCSQLEIAPYDKALTMPYCMQGAMMGDQRQFKDESGILWQIKGASCIEVEDTTQAQAYLRDRVQE